MSASSRDQSGRAAVWALVREVNEQIAETFDEYGPGKAGSLHLVCECGQPGCSELVSVERERFEEVRSVPGRRVVRRGHELDDEVALQSGGWAVVS